MAKDYAKANPQQLIKLSGKDSFVEVMNTSFDIGKILFNFVKYNDKAEAKNKVTDDVPMYMDLDEALVLARDISTGRIPQLSKIEKDKGAKYPQAVYKKQGGTSAQRLQSSGRSRPDGKAESRVIKIGPGAKAEFMFVAEKGMGEESETGLIVQKKVESTIRVPISGEDLKKLALVIESHIMAYRTSKYVSGEALTNPYQEARKNQEAQGA